MEYYESIEKGKEDFYFIILFWLVSVEFYSSSTAKNKKEGWNKKRIWVIYINVSEHVYAIMNKVLKLVYHTDEKKPTEWEKDLKIK